MILLAHKYYEDVDKPSTRSSSNVIIMIRNLCLVELENQKMKRLSLSSALLIYSPLEVIIMSSFFFFGLKNLSFFIIFLGCCVEGTIKRRESKPEFSEDEEMLMARMYRLVGPRLTLY